MQTLIDLFDTFQGHGEKTAFVNRTGVRTFSYSYRRVAEQSLRMANFLQREGAGRGERVLLWGPNSSWWGVAFWGIQLAGAVAVPVDFMSERERAETIRGLTGCKVVLQSRFKLERLDASPSFFLEDLEFLLEEVEPVADRAQPAPDDLAQLIYTSGTTGNPKGVMLTHANLTSNLLQVNQHIPVVTSHFNFLSLLPLSHMFEQMGGFFTPLYRGASVIYPRTLKPSAIMEALAEEDVYAMIAVPRLLQLLKSSIERELEERHLSPAFRFLMARSATLSGSVRRALFFPVHKKFGRHFQLFVSGGAPLSAETFEFWHRLGFLVLEGYGLTECSPVLCANTIERQVAGSVGKALPGVEVRIADNKEILARGPNVFPGYYQNERATANAFFEEGWFRTGDMGELAPDGWLTIKGREKELIVTGSGVNVYPDELEEVLNRTPGVRESCVIGLSRGGGEEVHAVLLLDASGRSPEQIVAEANQKLDSLHQITSHSIWPEPEFPKTTTMKIRKFVVQEEVQKGRQGGEGTVSADRLVNLLARVTGTPAAEVREDSLLMADLGLTSIGRLELVNYLEQEFRLDVDDSSIGPQTRVSDLRRTIEKREKPVGGGRFRFWTNSAPLRGVRAFWDAVFHYPVLRSVVSLEVQGGELLEQLQGPVLFVSNHSSYLDQPCIMFALPRRLRYRTATAAWAEFFFQNFRSRLEKLWKVFTYEYATLLLNVFPLPQTRGFAGSLRFMGRLADNGINILLFPEGEHSRDGSLHRFQPGLGLMARELAIPVVPIKVTGTQQVLRPGSRRIVPGKVTVRFGSPLHFRREEPDQIVALTRQAVLEL